MHWGFDTPYSNLFLNNYKIDTMMPDTLKTEFGTAKISKTGYYHITSRKEGNMLKTLHRLIWEKFYNFTIPDGYVIHHKDGNKLNNCILNLQLISNKNHTKLHSSGEDNYWYNKFHSLSSLKKMSKSKNTTGYFRVSKQQCPKCKKGWIYAYRGIINGEHIIIKSTKIEKLKEKVISKGYEWYEFNGDNYG